MRGLLATLIHAALLAAPAQASALIVRVEFSGVIDSMVYQGAPTPLPAEWSTGSTFFGFYEYDTDGAQFPEDGGSIEFDGGSLGWTTGAISAFDPAAYTRLHDHDPGLGRDSLDLVELSGGATGLPFDLFDFRYGVALIDEDGTWLAGPTLPAAPPELSETERAMLYFSGYIVDDNGVDLVGTFQVSGPIQTLRIVPEPTAAALLGLGLVGLALRKKAIQ